MKGNGALTSLFCELFSFLPTRGTHIPDTINYKNRIDEENIFVYMNYITKKNKQKKQKKKNRYCVTEYVYM